MDTVTSNGVIYVKANVLAKRYHYTTDYIGQLCRQTKVGAQLVGRAWYVNEESLLAHKGDRYNPVRPAEILSKNKHEIPVSTVEPKVRVDVHPRLSKAAHRLFFMHTENEVMTDGKNWMSRSPVYYSDTTAVEPPAIGVKVVSSKASAPTVAVEVKEPEPEVYKVAIANSSPKAVKLDFTDIPAVFMDGELTIESLDTEDEYLDIDPVLPEEIEIEELVSRPGITLRYSPVTPKRVAAVRAMPVTVKSAAPSVVTAPQNPHYTSRVAVSNNLKSNRIFMLPVFLILFACVIAGALLAVTGHIVSDGSTIHQTITFNMATVFEVLSGVAARY